MRKLLACLLCFFCLFSAASAGQVSFGDVSFDSAAETVDLGDRAVGSKEWPEFIAFLKEFPNLKRVDMFATQIDRDHVSLLENALPGVAFGWKLQLMKYKNKHIVRTDADYFSTLHGQCPNHNDSDFLLIGYCTGLLALDLGHNYLKDLSFLRNMPRLRVLILGENPTLKNIDPISELRDLEYLELFTCGITDISPLAKLPNLTDLNLCNNKVQDWRPLKEMKQLRRLWISGMCAKKMTAEERRELQEALPDTEIVFSSKSPTSGGWRFFNDSKGNKDPENRVPHYDVIYRMSQENRYIPFEESPPLPGEEAPSLVTEDIEEILPVPGE